MKIWNASWTVLCIVFAFANLSPAQAQTQAQGAQNEGTRHGDWLHSCRTPKDKPEVCLLVQKVSRKVGDKNQVLMSTVVRHLGPEKKLGFVFTLPLGLRLPPGLELRVDDKGPTQTIPYQICYQVGCQAWFVLDDAWLARLKAGLKATVKVRNRSGRVLTVPMSLKGLTAGIRAINAG